MIVDPGQVHDDRVALPDDLGLGHAERVDAFANALDGEVEALGVELSDGLLGDRHTTLQVEAEGWFVPRDEVRGQGAENDDEQAEQGDREATARHGRVTRGWETPVRWALRPRSPRRD